MRFDKALLSIAEGFSASGSKIKYLRSWWACRTMSANI
jgi:hypothetical protein